MAAPNFDFDYKPVKPARFTKWVPKKWRPEYERVVIMSATGLSNTQIAEKTGFTKQHVSNILNLPQAEQLQAKIVERMRERALTDIPSVLNRVAEKAAERLEKMINNDELFEKNPFAVIDRGMDVIKGLNHLKSKAPEQGNTTVNGNAVILNLRDVDEIAAGLEKLAEVKRLHG